jgi:triosephosphate isomerase
MHVLYGGSVKPENAEELIQISGVNGFLIGGASLDIESFTSITRIVEHVQMRTL